MLAAAEAVLAMKVPNTRLASSNAAPDIDPAFSISRLGMSLRAPSSADMPQFTLDVEL